MLQIKGRIKGIVAYTMAKEILKSGDYMVLDEIENHFNKEIVSTLVRFFMDSKFNKNGGTLLSSIKMYSEVSKVRKGEHTLLDLLK